MKLLYKLYFFAAMVVLFAVVSCKKFIKEELVTTLTEDYYKTENGLLDLVKSAYTPLKWKFEGEQAFSLWNYGLDEFAVGDQLNSGQFNSYASEFNSNGADGFLNNMWINYYAGINRCNLGIENISAYTSSDATAALGTQAKRDQRIAELKFLRAYYYFTMVQQMGGVPLVTTASRELRTEFPRNTITEVYNQVIADLKAAGLALPWRQTAEFGRASKAAAYHFLAKAYLARGSAVTDQRGQKSTDMDSAIVFADSVIRFSGHALEANFGNLFNASYATHSVPRAGTDGTPPVGSIASINANNNSNEIIFSAQFSQITSLSGLNNTVHLYFGSQYDAGIAGMARDLFNGRPFRRLRPTDYTIDIFDWPNDSRFFKTFQTAFYRNVTSNSGLPVYTAANAPTPDVVGKPRIGIGDTAALYIVNKPDSALLTSTIAAYRYYVTFARYKKTAANATPTTDFTAAKYLHMIKWMDPVRIPGSTQGVAEAKGIRNGTLARLGETYLILAEAYGRKGDYSNALLNVNIIRNRAAYKTGEAKNPSNYMFYGKPVNDVTSSAPAMQATTTLFTTNAASELYPVNVTSTADRFINFMLNERTRELCGELLRWEDLARTETFYNRTKLFNTTATFVAPYHKLRPIPLPQIISQTKNGNTLSAAEIAAYQNPGYQ